MSDWECPSCKLMNDWKDDKCVACFALNKQKFWKCKKCGLLNEKGRSKCSACFSLEPPAYKLRNKWSKSYLNFSHLSYENRLKMISWNNKLYSMVILAAYGTFDIVMLEHDKYRCNQYIFCSFLPSIHANIECITYDMDRELGELYVLLKIARFNDLLLIIYDLNNQRKKKQITINCAELNKKSNDDTMFGGMCMVKIKNPSSMEDQIPFKIIHHWSHRSDSSFPFKPEMIPDTVYKLIHRFYSYHQENKFHIILVKRLMNKYSDYISYTMSYGYVDLSSRRHRQKTVRFQLLWNNKVMKQETLGLGDAAFRGLFAVVIGSTFYWYFSSLVVAINMNDGYMQMKKVKDAGFGGYAGYLGQDVLEMNNDKSRYLYLLHYKSTRNGQRGNTSYFDVLCYDKQSKEVMTIKENVRCNVLHGEALVVEDMVYHDESLHIGQDVHYQLKFNKL